MNVYIETRIHNILLLFSFPSDQKTTPRCGSRRPKVFIRIELLR